MQKLPVVLIILFSCKSSVRQMPYFEPSAVTQEAGKQVAKQIVLLTSTSDSDLEKRIKSDPRLEEKLNELLVSEGKRRVISNALRSLLSVPKQLLLWEAMDAANDWYYEAAAEFELALAEDGSLPTDIAVDEYEPEIIWERTFDNAKTSTLAKLNFGMLNALIYTVVPDKTLYKAEDANLFTDTVVIYADDLDAFLNKVERAINISEKRQMEIGEGWYTLGRLLSPVRLYREAMHLGKAFAFSQRQGVSGDGQSSVDLVFTAFGAYLATAIFVGDEIVSMAKAATGRNITGLSKWIHDKAEATSKWKVFSRAKNVDWGEQHVARFSRRAIRLGLALPIVIAAHIVGRVMGTTVDTQPQFKQDLDIPPNKELP